MSETWLSAKNGWYIKSPGFMRAKPDYQRVSHKNARDRIERGNVVLFVHINQGRETECRTYVPYESVALLEAENAKLKNLVEDLWGGFECGYPKVCEECERDGSGKPTDMCVLIKRMRELGIEINDDRPS